MSQLAFRIYIEHNIPSVRAGLKEMESSIDFHDVVEEGITAIQLSQIGQAPIGSGPGVHGRIPRSIEKADVRRIDSHGSVEGVSRTRYGPAVFTNVGTGLHGPKHSEYFIPRPDWGEGRGIWHPGIRGTHWWERGANLGSPLALAAFRRKVMTILRIRGF